MTAKKPAPAAQQEPPQTNGAEQPLLDPGVEHELEGQAEIEAATLDLIARMTAPHNSARYNQRWLAIARTQIELGFMALGRATLNE